MPFGLCNAPAMFEHQMEQILGDMQWHKLLVYLDYVIAYGQQVDDQSTLGFIWVL